MAISSDCQRYVVMDGKSAFLTRQTGTRFLSAWVGRVSEFMPPSAARSSARSSAARLRKLAGISPQRVCLPSSALVPPASTPGGRWRAEWWRH